MRRIWLIFAQSVTVAVAVVFVLGTFKPGWLQQAPGRSVKMVYRLLRHLPADRSYRVIFMRRHTDEILRSQKKMLEHKGITTDIPDDVMKAMFERELRNFYGWLPSQSHLQLMNVSYNDLLSTPAAVVNRISEFLGGDLNVQSMTAKQMAQMIWYLMDGIQSGKQEASITNLQEFNHFNTAFAEVATTFLQSKRTGRWWMQLPNKEFTACSSKDYKKACMDQIPERWLRTLERSA